MRLRTLNLLKYGIFSDQAFEFGDGAVDLHLIVGPNEAGKSTLLNGISDLLFTIHDRTPYGFLHGMSELAIGATLEHGEERLEVVRRKKRKDPLVRPDGSPLSEAELAPFLGGIDRAAFTKMFGLNQARLREGGDSFLDGAQDAAKTMLEAEGGLSGLGSLLADLDTQADGLFSAQAKVRPLNLQLKARKDAEHAARELAVDERQWSALNERQRQAQATRDQLGVRLAEIAARLTTIERIRRVRPLLSAIEQRAGDLAPLTALPHFPQDADTRRLEAERTLTAGEARLEALQESLARKQADVILEFDAALLLAAPEIERLQSQRAVYDDRLRALPRRMDDLSALRDATEKLKAEGGLLELTELPGKIQRERLRKAFQAVRDARAERARLSDLLKGQQRDLEVETHRLVAIGPVDGLAPLKDLLDKIPRDLSKQLAASKRSVEAAERNLVNERHRLSPWEGDLSVLAALSVPSPATIEDARLRSARLEAEASELRRERAEAQMRLADARAELAKLVGDGALLPTQAVLKAARQTRDAAWVHHRARRIEDTTSSADLTGDADAYEALVLAADELADRRQSEAARLAAHVIHSAEIDRLTARKDSTNAELERVAVDMEQAKATWRLVCRTAGFSTDLAPTDMASWVIARQTVLVAQENLTRNRSESQGALDQGDRQLRALRQALAAIKEPFEDIDDSDAVIAHAAQAVKRLDAKQLERATLAQTVARLTTEVSRSSQALTVSEANLQLAEQSFVAALRDCGVDPASDDVATGIALGALDELTSGLGALDQMSGRVRDIRADITEFETAALALFAQLGRSTPTDISVAVATLAQELIALASAKAESDRARNEALMLQGEAETLRQSLANARAILAELIALAGVEAPSELAEAIANARQRDDLETELSRLRDEIEKAADGAPLDALRLEVMATTQEDLAAEHATLNNERTDLVEQRDAAATDLSEAIRMVKEKASGEGAAQALQDAEDARAQASVQAERYVEAKSVAALLRWAIGRHRKTRAAPLLASASTIMASITSGSFVALELDFEKDEHPVVVGVRSSGAVVPSHAMSEGTRDQLYLALRLAAVEQRAGRHPMLFIADDLLVNGDDERCAAMLTALCRLSKSCQVLCFTHHQHLIPIADRALGAGGFHLHRIGRSDADVLPTPLALAMS